MPSQLPQVLAQQAPQDLGGIAGFAVDLVETFGGPGAGFATAVENLFPPVPSEVILPLTGFAAARGVLGVPSALAWTTAGSVLGAVILYYLGAVMGRDRVARLWHRMPLVDDHDLGRTEAWFARHGHRAVFLGRMVPGFRSLVSIPAGVEHMPLPQFLLYTTAGSLTWNAVLIAAGYFLGAQYELVADWVSRFSTVVLVAVVVAVAAFAIRRVRRRRTTGRSTSP